MAGEKRSDLVMELIYKDEPLVAYYYLEKTKDKEEKKIRRRLRRKLDHIFNYERYLEKYANDPMKWRPLIQYHTRFDWILEEVRKESPKSLIDLGCYEGTLVFLCATNFDMKLRGVDICKEAVNWNNERAKRFKGDIKFFQSSVEEYQDKNKYDFVVCMELVEHVPNPRNIVDKMLDLVSDNGWCYLTTPDGVYDSREGKRVWETRGAVFDHIRTFGPKKLLSLLSGCDVVVYHNNVRGLFVKFRKRK